MPRPEGTAPERTDLLSQPGVWLVLADERGAGESLRTRLTSSGHRCILARPGPSFVRQRGDRFALDPANRADFERLLEEAGITTDTPFRGVLHLWSLDLPAFEIMTGEDLAQSQLLGGAALHLLQAVSSLKTKLPPCVWLVTRGRSRYQIPLQSMRRWRRYSASGRSSLRSIPSCVAGVSIWTAADR